MPAEVEAGQSPRDPAQEQPQEQAQGVILTVTPAEEEKQEEPTASVTKQDKVSMPALPAFASSERPPPPAASPFARPASFPSVHWPAPPLDILNAPGGVQTLSAMLAPLPAGNRDRFARWAIGTLSLVSYSGERTPQGVPHGRGEAKFKCGSHYVGSWEHGLMHGDGTYTWADGCSYRGSLSHQAVTGFGLLSWPDGATYQGEVLDGHRHGKGVFIDPHVPCMYEGEWVGGLRQGEGTLTYDDAGEHFYRGAWQQGARHGFGTLRYASGNQYEGEWVWDRKEGQGTMHWINRNQRYTGQWAQDKPHGEGEYTWMDLPVAPPRPAKSGAAPVPAPSHFLQPNRYVGSLCMGVRHGAGAFFYSDGSVYSGQWVRDRKHDPQGRFIFPNGSVYEGPFKEDQMEDKERWNNPHSGVAAAAAAAVAEQNAAAASALANAGSPKSPKSKGAKKQGLSATTALSSSSSTTTKDTGLFDLPLDDLFLAHARSVQGMSAPDAVGSFVSAQKEQVANVLLRYNSELLDVYRFYAQAPVEAAQPEGTPAGGAASPVHAAASSSNQAGGGRMNLAQLWMLFSDIGLVGAANPNTAATPAPSSSSPAVPSAPSSSSPPLPRPLSLARLDRLVFSRMLSGTDEGAQAARLAQGPGSRALQHVHDPRNPVVLREFLEALVRAAEEVYDTDSSNSSGKGDKPEEEAKEAKESVQQDQGEEKRPEPDESADDDDASATPPSVHYARALHSFNHLLLGTSAPPTPSQLELQLPLHSLSLSATLGPKGSQQGASTFATATTTTTTADRFKRVLIEVLLPRARTRSKHAHGHSLAPLQQPIFKLPPIVAMLRRYERDLYAQVFLPHATQRLAPVAPSEDRVSGWVSSLPPLQDRTLSLSSLLSVLSAAPSVVFTPYFNVYHCLDALFGPRSYLSLSRARSTPLELLFPELLDTLVRLGLYRGKVLGAVAASLRAEHEAVERIRRERREAIEAEARRVAAESEEAQAHAAAAADVEPTAKKGSKSGSAGKSAGGSGPSSKPSSASKKASNAGTASSAAAPKGKLSVATSKQAGKSPSATPRSASSKKDKGSKPGTARGAGSARARAATSATLAAATASGSLASSTPQGSAPSSSRASAAAGAGAGAGTGAAQAHGVGETGSLRKRVEGLSLGDDAIGGVGGPFGAWSVSEQDADRLCADAEAFLCALLGRTVPASLQSQASFPAIMVELEDEPE